MYDQVVADLGKRLKSDEDYDILAETLKSYFESKVGLELFSDNNKKQNIIFPTIGLEGKYYPKYLQIELTKSAIWNVLIVVCYKII